MCVCECVCVCVCVCSFVTSARRLKEFLFVIYVSDVFTIERTLKVSKTIILVNLALFNTTNFFVGKIESRNFMTF